MSRQSKCAAAAIIGTPLLWSAVPHACAQTTSAAAPVESKMRTKASGLEEITVTAQRRSERLEKTPVAVTALSAKSLTDQAVKTQNDLQNAAPGLQIRSTQGGNDLSFALRGQIQDAASNTQPSVLTYIDEVHVDTASSSALYDLQSVQVLKGPQGTLFGRNATGGAVLFTTAKPTNQFGGYMQTRTGDYGLTSTEGAINLPVVKDKVSLRLSGFYANRNGFDYNIFNRSHPGSIVEAAGRATLVVDPVANLHNTTVVDYFHGGGTDLPGVLYSTYAPGTTFGGNTLSSVAAMLYGPTLDMIAGPGAFATYLAANPKVYPGGLLAFQKLQSQRGPFLVDINSSQAHRADNILVSSVTTYDINSDLQLKDVFGFGRSDARDQVELSDSPYTIIGTRGGGEAGFKDTDYSEEAQVLGKAIAEKLTYVAGFFYSNSSSYTRSTATQVDLSPIIPGSHIQHGGVNGDLSYAGYAQGTYDLSQLTGLHGLGFTTGFRYTDETVSESVDHNSQYFNYPGGSNYLSSRVGEWSWQFGVQEQLTPNTLLYAVSRHSFRSGGFNIAAPPVPGTAAENGPAFNPETATDLEIGAKYLGRLGNMPFRTNIAAYREWVKDVQRSADITVLATTTAVTLNVPSAEVTGVELDSQINPFPWLQLGGNIAVTDGEFTDGVSNIFGNLSIFDPYSNTPKLSGAAFAEGTFPFSGTMGTLSLRSDVYAQSKNYYSSFASTITPYTELPGYALINFRIAISNIAGKPLTIAAYLKNAANKRYFIGGQPLGNAIGFNTAQPGNPRTFFFEVTYKF